MFLSVLVVAIKIEKKITLEQETAYEFQLEETFKVIFVMLAYSL